MSIWDRLRRGWRDLQLEGGHRKEELDWEAGEFHDLCLCGGFFGSGVSFGKRGVVINTRIL